MNPEVSVVIPTHNRPMHVRRAVASALAQTVDAIEVIVVDDGSATPVTSKVLGTDDPRVSIIRHDAGRGVSRARNAGIAAARAPWIAFLDDDDYWSPGKLSLQIGAARRHGAGLVYTSVIVVDEDGRLVYPRDIGRYRDHTGALISGNVVGEPSTVLVRRDALEAAGPFTERLSTLADWDMWFRLSRVTPVYGLKHRLTAIMMHPGNMQVRDIERAEHEFAVMAERHAGVLAAYGTDRFASKWIDLWFADKRRHAAPSWRATAAYARRQVRCYGLFPTGRRVVWRVVARVRGRRPPPPWARQPLS